METVTDHFLIHAFFPFSNQVGQPTDGIDKKRITSLAKTAKPVLQNELEKIVEKHFEFLSAGGAGGEWQSILVGGLVVGLYNIPVDARHGEQANFERANLNKTKMADMEIPFANFCGAYSENGNFSNTNLSYCLFSDSFLEGANFTGSNLQKTDFSRANLRGANFQHANLSGVDFENCDLQGADFRNTKLSDTRFPGANLEGVLHSF